MTSEIRDEVSELIADLHRLYRATDVQSFHNDIGNIRNRIDALSVKATTLTSVKSVTGEIPGVVTTQDSPPFHIRLKQHIHQSDHVRIASAFLSASDMNPIVLPIKDLLDRGGKVAILTSLMGFLNSPETLRSFCEWGTGLECRIYANDVSQPYGLFSDEPPAFHAKAILMNKSDLPDVLVVGSSNFTVAGFKNNIEWNYISDFEVNSPFADGPSAYTRAVTLFERLWKEHGYSPDSTFLARYSKLYARAQSLRRELRKISSSTFRDSISQDTFESEIVPRPVQQIALRKIADLRHDGADRCALIAASGLGKTFLSAFDARNFGARRVLFVCHRESILNQARESYTKVFGRTKQIIIQGRNSLSGLSANATQEIQVFGMVQTLGNLKSLERLGSDFFDYIVVDEFHHSAAPTYRRLIDYFHPKFLLGLTATPERADGRDVLSICNYVIAYEVRLFDAIRKGWLCTFHYYALYDPTDYSKVRWTGTGYDEEQLEQTLSKDTRVELIVRNLRRFQPPNGKRKAIAFCSNVGHAIWMAKAFNGLGISAESLLGSTSNEDRAHYLKNLQDEDHELEIVCAVDVLNEGVDIPSLTHVLLLRPTSSFTVFLQQIGRGLRMSPGKPFVTILDFVGNFHNSFIAPLTFNEHYGMPFKLKKKMIDDTFNLPDGCYVDVERRVQRIWNQQIEQKFLKVSNIDRIRTMLDELVEDPEFHVHEISEIRLPDLFTLSDSQQVAKLIRKMGGWLKVKSRLGIAYEYEKSLINGPAENFLAHIEEELHPSKSYKMTVLHSLLVLEYTKQERMIAWNIEEIAESFLRYYLQDPVKRQDWPELDRAEDPFSFPLSKAISHICKMPLHFLSDKEEKYFILLEDENSFFLKNPFCVFWENSDFHRLVKERVEYAEALYWYSRSRRE